MRDSQFYCIKVLRTYNLIKSSKQELTLTDISSGTGIDKEPQKHILNLLEGLDKIKRTKREAITYGIK